MKFVSRTLYFLFSIIVASGVFTVQSQIAAPEPAMTDNPAPPLTIEVNADSLVNAAGRAYHDLQVAKYDGMDNNAFFQQAYALYKQTLEALEAQTPESAGVARCKDILTDLDNEMLKGAFFYSGESNMEELNKFAQAYLDIQLLPQFATHTWARNAQVFPFVTYIAASSAYNAKEWDKAIDYFKLYFTTDDTEHREQVYMFMGQACLNAGNYPLAISTMQSGMEQYPLNELMPMIGVQASVDGGHAQFLQDFLTKALEFKPSDEQLLTIQGKLLEDENDYKGAISVFSTLDSLKPNSLVVAKHLGMNFYNLAVSYFNKAINEKEEKNAKRMRHQAKSYFEAAATKFRQVVDNDPNAIKYMKALGVCCLCLEDKEGFTRINERLAALGHDPLEEVFMPPVINYTESGRKNYDTSSVTAAGTAPQAPGYNDFANEYVTSRMQKWAKPGEFEPKSEYDKRVNDRTIQAEIDRLTRLAADEYLNLYADKLRLNDLTLEPYDATNEVFKISTNYGPIYVNVPLKNNEAETFKATFAGIKFRAPRYFIDSDGVRIASLTLETVGGKTYNYDNAKAREYNGVPQVNIDWTSFQAPTTTGTSKSTHYEEAGVIRRKSDVDENIPATGKKNPDRLALIIANEKYANVPDVASALNDGETFAEYCRQTLGMPDQNVTLVRNASLTNILRAVAGLKNKVDACNGTAEVTLYYAGHGMPDERTKDAYILPVDGDPQISETCYPLSRLYNELGDLKAASVCVFIDACFSGAQRQQDGKMLTEARSVVIKPKASAPKGNMLVFTAASGQETALPYADKNHGLFTYFLLKNIQDSKGNITLKELCDRVTENVKRTSSFVNEKPQNPTAVTSGNMSQMWLTKKLRP